MKYPLLWLIRIYQVTIAGLMPNVCRFEPSCSRYGYEAIDRYGALRGGWLTLRRLARCRPGGGRGYDPVPGGDESP
ncbi:MAG: membrane protein insertion efficiency factor YidD [Chloroflexi bacterium]|nr:membrane protein insertion efficiency factor YidD [Chloroflexota bacterium]